MGKKPIERALIKIDEAPRKLGTWSDHFKTELEASASNKVPKTAMKTLELLVKSPQIKKLILKSDQLDFVFSFSFEHIAKLIS